MNATDATSEIGGIPAINKTIAQDVITNTAFADLRNKVQNNGPFLYNC